jgi:hypothetical protein
MLSPPLSSPRRYAVYKLISAAVVMLLTLTTLVCLILAAPADGLGPPP